MFSCSFLRARLHKHIAFASAQTHSFSARAMFIRLIAQPCTSISDRCEGVLSIAVFSARPISMGFFCRGLAPESCLPSSLIIYCASLYSS